SGTFSISDAPIGRSRVYFGLTSTSGYLERVDNVEDPTTNHSLWRTDVQPTVRASLSTLSFLNVTTRASWRFTEWSQSRDPATASNLPAPIWRQLLDLNATVVGPIFSRVFQPKDNGYAEKFMNYLEPSLTIDWKSPFTRFDSIVQNDG